MTRSQANCLLMLAACLWGSGNVAQQTILREISPVTAVGLRCLIASVVILPFFKWHSTPSFNFPKTGRGLLLMTTCCFGLAVTLQQIGFGLTTVSNGSFLVNSCTVMVPLGVWLYLGVRPSAMVWPAAAATLAGTCFMGGGVPTAFSFGDMVCLLAALGFTVWTICLSEHMRRFNNALSISFTQFACTGLAGTVLGMLWEPISVEHIWKVAPELVFLGVCSTGLAYAFQAMAMAHTKASEATIIVSGEAIFGALGGIFLLGEALSLFGLLGAGLIFGGIVLMQVPANWFANPDLR